MINQPRAGEPVVGQGVARLAGVCRSSRVVGIAIDDPRLLELMKYPTADRLAAVLGVPFAIPLPDEGQHVVDAETRFFGRRPVVGGTEVGQRE